MTASVRATLRPNALVISRETKLTRTLGGMRASASLTGGFWKLKLTAHRNTDQGVSNLLPSFSDCKFSCPKYKDQVDLSLFESRKPALSSLTWTWKWRSTPSLPFPAFSSFVPLPPCCFILKKPLSVSLDGGKIQRPRVLGLSPNSQNQKPFFLS